MPFLLPLLGGALIGLAASLLWIGHGRRAGVSGLFGDVVAGAVRDERLAFVAGLVAVGVASALLFPASVVASPAALPLVAIAGVLTGFGTRLGSGCTSGHGVCGVARLAPRSIVATLTFMAVAVVTVFVTRHMVGAQP